MVNNVNNNQAQQAPAPEQKPDPNKQNVSDKQANDFADQINKDKKKKPEGKKEDEQSLESLLAERSKSKKNAIEGRLKDQQREGGQGDTQQQQTLLAELALAQGADAKVKTNMQIREMQQAASVKEVNAALQKMADQIHVSAKDAVNGAEIRISLKDSVMPGTEIRIMRNAGELTVTLNTRSAEANNFFASHEASLQKALAERFGDEKVSVNINMSGGDTPEDGRSRNQYSGDENNDEAEQQAD